MDLEVNEVSELTKCGIFGEDGLELCHCVRWICNHTFVVSQFRNRGDCLLFLKGEREHGPQVSVLDEHLRGRGGVDLHYSRRVVAQHRLRERIQPHSKKCSGHSHSVSRRPRHLYTQNSASKSLAQYQERMPGRKIYSDPTAAMVVMQYPILPGNGLCKPLEVFWCPPLSLGLGED